MKCRRRKITRRMGRQETTTSAEMSSKENPQEEVLLQFPSSLDMSTKDRLHEEVVLQLPMSLEMQNMDRTQKKALMKFSFFREEAVDL